MHRSFKFTAIAFFAASVSAFIVDPQMATKTTQLTAASKPG